MNSLLLLSLLLLQGSTSTTTGNVTGRLQMSAGGAASGIRVMAMTVPDPSDAGDLPILASLTQSDINGNFRLENIPPGIYYITAGAVDFPTYFPGGTSAIGAKTIAVVAGSTVSNVDFSLAKEASLKVSGHLTAEPGAQIPAILRLVGVPGQERTMSRNPDGTFEFRDVHPGNYEIRGTGPDDIFQTVNVVDKDVTV